MKKINLTYYEISLKELGEKLGIENITSVGNTTIINDSDDVINGISIMVGEK